MPLKHETDVAGIAAEVVFQIARHAHMSDVCALRATCSLFARQFDSASANSEEWRTLACASLGVAAAPAVPRHAPTLANSTWADACRVLARHPASTPWIAGSGGSLGTLSVSPSSIHHLLDWFVVAAEVAAVDCQVPFGTVLTGEGRSQASLAVYTACSQKPPQNMQSQVYSWWVQHAFEVVGAIRSRMARADEAAQQRARASFGSFVRQMTSIVLPYLDRFYVRRYEVAGDATSSLPTVREIGRRAVEMLELPFDAPLPVEAASPCPEIPLTAERGVDEVALSQRQRRAWHQRDLERFDQILGAVGGVGRVLLRPAQGRLRRAAHESSAGA